MWIKHPAKPKRKLVRFQADQKDDPTQPEPIRLTYDPVEKPAARCKGEGPFAWAGQVTAGDSS